MNLEKKIKKKLVNKKFNKWNKKSILFLVSIFENPKNNKWFDNILVIFDEYIRWYKENNYITDQYSLPVLIDLYCLINTNLYKGISMNYIDYLDKKPISENDSIFDIYFYLLIACIFIIIKFIFSLDIYSKKEEKKNIFELQIPIPENIINNPLIKYFLGNIII